MVVENHHFIGKIHYKWPFSLAMLNYQSVAELVTELAPMSPENDGFTAEINGFLVLKIQRYPEKSDRSSVH